MQTLQKFFSNSRVRLTGIIVAAILGAFIGVTLLGPADYDMEGLTINLALTPSKSSQTVLHIPPVGNLSAKTHQAPFDIHITLMRIGTNIVTDQQIIDNAKKTFVDGLDKNVRKLVQPFLLRQLLAGILGAVILVLLIYKPSLKHIFLSTISAGLLLAFIFACGYTTYQPEAFREPNYDGVISLAPDMMQLAEQLLKDVDQLQANTRAVFNNVRILFNKVDTLSFLGNLDKEKAMKSILIVSDLHSNPIGIEVIQSITKNFDIDYIINAGDMSDYGSSIEMKLAASLNSITQPTVFAAGNHDTPEVVEFMANLPNTRVANGQTIPLGDFNVLGSPDPLAFHSEAAYTDQYIEQEELQAQIADLITAAERARPDIIVVHNPKYAEALSHLAQVIVTGHTHSLSVKQIDETVFLNPGTTGAAGARGVYSDTEIPYTAIILYMEKGKPPAVIDQIAYHPASGRFSIERNLLKLDDN